MLLTDAPLTFREFMTQEELPLAMLFREIFGFLAGRRDVVLFGAQAVNAYCEPARMTADVDLMALDADAFAEALRVHLAGRFHIAVRVQRAGGGLRLYQVRRPANRHLVDIRPAETLPDSQEIAGIRVLAPAELAAMKVVSVAARCDRPKGDTDLADLRRLLLAFPDLRQPESEVAGRLASSGAAPAVLAVWGEVRSRQIAPDLDDG